VAVGAPPRCWVDSPAATTASSAASASRSPRARPAASVPSSVSPAPVLSTGVGSTMAGCRLTCPPSVTSSGAAPLVTATAAPVSAPSAAVTAAGSVTPSSGAESPGLAILTSRQCGVTARNTRRAGSASVSSGRKFTS
jgi:hypothetical protein